MFGKVTNTQSILHKPKTINCLHCAYSTEIHNKGRHVASNFTENNTISQHKLGF